MTIINEIRLELQVLVSAFFYSIGKYAYRTDSAFAFIFKRANTALLHFFFILQNEAILEIRVDKSLLNLCFSRE